MESKETQCFSFANFGCIAFAHVPNQNKYDHDILKKFEMDTCKLVPTSIVPGLKLSKNDNSPKVDSTMFKRLVGSLMYLTSTWPDLQYSMSLISRFMEEPRETHWQAGKRILRYISGTQDFGILYSVAPHIFHLIGYTDSDYASNVDDKKNTTGYVFHLGLGVISWASQK